MAALFVTVAACGPSSSGDAAADGADVVAADDLRSDDAADALETGMDGPTDPPGCIPTSDASRTDSGGADADAGDASPGIGGFSVVTFNVLHGILDEDPAAEPFDRLPERLAFVARELASMRPAVIELQEVLRPSARPGYPDVIATLVDALNASGGDPYVAVFGDNGGYPPTCPPGNGLGQATLTRLPVEATRNHSVVAVIPFEPRTVLHVRVRAPFGVVDTYNVHISGPEDRVRGEREMRDVLTFVDATAAASSAVFLAGDFNVYDTDAAMQLVRDARFVDLGAASMLTCRSRGDRGCTNSNIPLAMPGLRADVRIDYIWLRAPTPRLFRTQPLFDQPFTLPDGGVLFASDHVGVWAVALGTM